MRVDVNPTQLNTFGLGLEDIRTMLGSANANRPKGDFHDINRVWSISTTDQLRLAAQYSSLVVAYKNGAAVKLSDVATVTVGNQPRLGIAGQNDDDDIVHRFDPGRLAFGVAR